MYIISIWLKVCLSAIGLVVLFNGAHSANKDECGGYYYVCLFVRVNDAGTTEYKLISDRYRVAAKDEITGEENWRLIKLNDNYPLFTYTDDSVSIDFGNTGVKVNGLVGNGNMFGYKFVRKFKQVGDHKNQSQIAHDLTWWRANMSDDLTWFPLPDQTDIQILFKEANDELEKITKEVEGLEETIMDAEAKKELLNVEAKNLQSEYEKLEATLREKQAMIGSLNTDVINKKVAHEDNKVIKKGEETSACFDLEPKQEKANKAVLKKIVEIKMRQEEIKKSNEIKEANKETKKQKREEEEKERNERRLKRKDPKDKREKKEKPIVKKKAVQTHNPNTAPVPPSAVQKQLAKFLKKVFGRKSSFYQAYHGFFGKDLAKKKGLVYDIHEIIANVFRFMVGTSKIGIDL